MTFLVVVAPVHTMPPTTRTRTDTKNVKKKHAKNGKKTNKEEAIIVDSEIETDSETDNDNSELSTNLENLEKQFREQRKAFAKMIDSFDFMNSAFDELKGQIAKLTNDQKKMKKEMDRLTDSEKNLKKRVERLEMDVAKDKQRSNENHVIISNMPKVTAELKNTIIEIGKQVGCQLDKGDIIDAFQTENKKFKTFPIVVKLKTNDFKNKCIRYRKEGNAIDISSLVDSANVGDRNINFHALLEKEVADLLKQAKAAAKRKGYKFVWVSNTTVLVRKEEKARVIQINSSDDLKKIT